MTRVKEDIRIEGHGPLPLTPPLDEQVLRVELRLPSGERAEVINVHAPNPAANQKVFWEELASVAHATVCLMAGDVNSLSDAHDADYTPVWSANEKAVMRLEQDLVEDWELQDAWPLMRAREESQDGYPHTHMYSRGVVRRRIDRLHVPLRWAGAMAQVQVVSSSHGGVHTGVVADAAAGPNTHVEDRELMEAQAQDIRTQIPPFPEQGQR